MPDNEKLVLGIVVETNAGSAANEVKQLDESLQSVDKTIEKTDKAREKSNKKHTKDTKNASKLNQKELDKQSKNIQKADNTQLKNRKKLLDIDKARLGIIKKFAGALIGATSAEAIISAFINKSLATVQSGRQYRSASALSGVDTGTIESTAFMLKQFGGDINSAAQNFTTVNSLLNTLRMGLPTAEEAAALFPAQYMKVFFDEQGKIVDDQVKFLDNLSKVLKGMSDAQALQFGQLLGITPDMIKLLREIDGKFAIQLDETKKQTAMTQGQAEELEKLNKSWDAFNRGINQSFADIISKISKLFPSDDKKMQKLGSDLGETAIYYAIFGPVAEKILRYKNLWELWEKKKSTPGDIPVSPIPETLSPTRRGKRVLGLGDDALWGIKPARTLNEINGTPLNNRNFVNEFFSRHITSKTLRNSMVNNITVNANTNDPQAIADEITKELKKYTESDYSIFYDLVEDTSGTNLN